MHVKKRTLVPVNEAGQRIGENHQRAVLADAEVEQILWLRFEAGLSYAKIAAKWDEPGHTISKSTVRAICTGRIRAQTPARWVALPVHKEDD